ncbi:MAG: hypothetical protein O3C27_09415, partial [Actinomycetota bacterium]|nr:hypothetical protein [Actinomycetota bacterium]
MPAPRSTAPRSMALRPTATRSTASRSTASHPTGQRGSGSHVRANAAARASRKRKRAPLFDPRRRLRLVLGGFLLIGFLFVGVLVDLQTGRAERLRDLGESQRSGTRSLAGYRGSIVDRDGFVLAASTPSLELVADPQMVRDPLATAAVLAPVLGVAPETLVDALVPQETSPRYGLVAESLDDATVARLAELLA